MQDMNCNGISSKDVLKQHGLALSRVPEATVQVGKQALMKEDTEEDDARDFDSDMDMDATDSDEVEELVTPQDLPLDRLPTEVLQHIFTWCVAGFDPVGVVKVRNTITSVSRRWRDAIRGAPEVWTLVPISGPAPIIVPFQCIERSKALPLKVFIDQRDPKWNGDENSYPFGPHEMVDLLNRLSKHFARMEELHIVVNTWTVIQAALSWLQRRPAPPLLRRLELRRHGPQYVVLEGPPPEGLTVPGCALFGGATPPVLKHVNLSGVHVHWDNTALVGLHHLSLRRLAVELAPSLDSFRKMLRRSPDLQYILLLDASPRMLVNQEALEPLPPIKLDRLTDLAIGRLTLEHAIYILDQISATNLRRLTISAFTSDDYAPLLRKVTGAFPGLTVLFMENFETQNQEEMYEFLKSIPNLRYLKVGGVASEFFQALCSYMPLPTNNSAQDSVEQWLPVCPQLEIVEITDIPFHTLHWFYDYRQRMGAPLRQIFLSYRFIPKLEQDNIRWLADLGPNAVRIVPYGSIPSNDPKYLS